jgi:hypothetical protein
MTDLPICCSLLILQRGNVEEMQANDSICC